MRNSWPEYRAYSVEIQRVEETSLADFTRFEGFEGIGDMRMVAINEKLKFTRRELRAEIKVTEKEDIAA